MRSQQLPIPNPMLDWIRRKEAVIFIGTDINDLVMRMPKDHTPEEVNWGAPVGKEVW